MIAEISYPTALMAGLLSFFSPCVLPLVPSYFTFITGSSVDTLTTDRSVAVRLKIILATTAFVTGFSMVFIIMGASASYASGLLIQARPYVRVIGGLLIIMLGLHLLGMLKIRALYADKRFHFRDKPLHFLGAFVIGMAFGAGWSPCIGPLLGSILILASSQETVTQGVWLLGVYALGLALPFVVLSMSIGFALRFVRRATRIMKHVNPAAGLLLIIIGALLMANKFDLLISYFY